MVKILPLPRLVFLVFWMSFFPCLSACKGHSTLRPSTQPVGELTQNIAPKGQQVTPILTLETENAPGSLATSTTNPILERNGLSLEAGSLFAVPGIELYTIDLNGMNLVNDMGAFWIRRNGVLWDQVEPQEGQRNWAALRGLEDELTLAASQGASVILVVRSTPAWAQQVPGSQCGPIVPEKLPSFAAFMHDLVERYSVPPYQVKYWEVWNEPDVDPSLVPGDCPFGCWGNINDPYYGGRYYAEMLKQVYPQVKSADPQAQLIVGGLLLDCDPLHPPEDKNCSPSLFLEGVLRAGGGFYFDGVSFHAYDYYIAPFQYANPNWHSTSNTSGPALIAKGRFLRSLLMAFGYPDKFLINSEAGLLCGQLGSEPQCEAQEFELSKADYLAISNATAIAEGLRANVWFSLMGWRGTALVDSSSRPLPAYHAFRFSAAMLTRTTAVREIVEFTGVRGYEYLGNRKRIWILWSVDGGDHAIQLLNIPEAIYDVFGTPLSPTQILQVGVSPVYVEWTP